MSSTLHPHRHRRDQQRAAEARARARARREREASTPPSDRASARAPEQDARRRQIADALAAHRASGPARAAAPAEDRTRRSPGAGGLRGFFGGRPRPAQGGPLQGRPRAGGPVTAQSLGTGTAGPVTAQSLGTGTAGPVTAQSLGTGTAPAPGGTQSLGTGTWSGSPPSPSDASLRERGQALVERYGAIADPAPTDLSGRGTSLGPVQVSLQLGNTHYEVADLGPYEGNDPARQGTHVFQLTSNRARGVGVPGLFTMDALGVGVGPVGVVGAKGRAETTQTTLHLSDAEAARLRGLLPVGDAEISAQRKADISAALGLTDGHRDLRDPRSLEVGDEASFRAVGNLGFSVHGAADLPVGGASMGYAFETKGTQSVQVKRLDTDTVEVTLAPERLDAHALFASLEAGLSVEDTGAETPFSDADLAGVGVSAHAGQAVHARLAQTFTFDLRDPAAMEAYKKAIGGQAPSSDISSFVPPRGQQLDAQGVLDAFANEQLPSGVERTFVETVEVPLRTFGVGADLPLAGRWGVDKLRAHGNVVVSDGDVAFTQELAAKRRTNATPFLGDETKASSAVVETLTDASGAERFQGLRLNLSLEDSKLRGRDLNRHITTLNDAFGLDIPAATRTGDGGSRRIGAQLELNAADLTRLGSLPPDQVRVAASAVGADQDKALDLVRDLSTTTDPHAAAQRLQTYVRTHGARGLATVARALDAKDRLDVTSASSTYDGAIEDAHALRDLYPDQIDPDDSSSALQHRFDAAYATLKKIDVATQELRDDRVLAKFDPAEVQTRQAELDTLRAAVNDTIDLSHLDAADTQAVYAKFRSQNVAARADRALAAYPDPIRADASKDELKARFAETEGALFQLEQKIGRIEEGDDRWVKPPLVADNYEPLDPSGETARLVELRDKRDALEASLSFDHLSVGERKDLRERVLNTQSGLRLGERSAASQAILRRLDASDARHEQAKALVGTFDANDANVIPTAPDDPKIVAVRDAFNGLIESNDGFADLFREYESVHGQPPRVGLVDNLARPAAWDPNDRAIVLKAGSGQFSDPAKLERRLTMELANAVQDERYADAWAKAKDGTLDQAGFVREMERIEYDAIQRHHDVFAGDPERDVFGDKLAGDWSTFEGFFGDQSRTRGSLQDGKASHTSLYEQAWLKAREGQQARPLVFHSTVPKGETSPLTQIADIETLTRDQVLAEVQTFEDAEVKAEMTTELGALFERVDGAFVAAGVDPSLHAGKTLEGQRAALNSLLPLASDRAAVRAVLKEFDALVPLPSTTGSGAFGNLGWQDGNLEGRAGWSAATEALVPTRTGQDRRHIVAHHNIRDGFSAMFERDPEGTEAALDAQNERIMGNLRTHFGNRVNTESADSLRRELLTDLRGDGTAAGEKEKLAEMRVFLDGMRHLRGGEASKPLSATLDAYSDMTGEDKVLMGVFQANNNPTNLWPGSGDVNQQLNSEFRKLTTSVQQATSLEDLRAKVDGWEAPSTTARQRLYDESKYILDEALDAADAELAELDPADRPAREAELLTEVKSLAEFVAHNAHDVDVDPLTSEFQTNYTNWRSMQAASDGLDAAAQGSPVDPATVVDGFLGYDPIAGVRPNVIGAGDQAARVQDAHDQLLEGSPAYRESFQAASAFGGDVNIEVVDDADRVASYDLASNTIRLKRSALEGGDDAKLMSRLAFEMSNAQNQVRFHGLVGSTQAALTSGAEVTAEDFSRRALDIEYDSLTNFNQIRDELTAAGGPTLSVDGGLEIPMDRETFIASQQAAKRPNNSGKVTLAEHYEAEFTRLQSAVAAGNGDAFSLEVWKPRGETAPAPGGTGHSRPTGDGVTADGTTGGGTTGGGTTGGGSGIGASDGAAGILFGPDRLEEDEEVEVEVEGGVSGSVGSGPFSASGSAGGSASAEAGYTANEDETSAGGQVQASGSVQAEVGAGPVTVGASAEGQAAAHASGGVDHHIDGDDATLGVSANAGVEANANVGGSVSVGNAEASGQVGVGVGAEVDASGKVIVRDGIPGVTVSAGFDAGVAVGGTATVGTEEVQATLEGGALAGVAAGAGGSFGMQEDGKFHIELNAKLAIGVGLEIGIDLAFDLDKIKDRLESLDPREWAPELAKFAGEVLRDTGLLAREAIDKIDEKVIQPLKEGFETLGDGFREAFRTVGDWGRKAVEEVGDFFEDVGEGIVDVAETVGDGIVDAAETVGDGIVDAAETVGDGFSNAASAVGGFFGGLFSSSGSSSSTAMETPRAQAATSRPSSSSASSSSSGPGGVRGDAARRRSGTSSSGRRGR